MAKLERTIYNTDFRSLLQRIEHGILHRSVSASLEDCSNFAEDDARCAVRVFERYSTIGSNRVSLSVTLFQQGDGPIHLSAITSGGSQALLLKINTWGEEAFLNKLEKLL